MAQVAVVIKNIHDVNQRLSCDKRTGGFDGQNSGVFVFTLQVEILYKRINLSSPLRMITRGPNPLLSIMLIESFTVFSPAWAGPARLNS